MFLKYLPLVYLSLTKNVLLLLLFKSVLLYSIVQHFFICLMYQWRGMLSNKLYTSRLRSSLHNLNDCHPKLFWSLRNIYCSMGNESASFYVDYIFLVSITDNAYFWLDLTLWVTLRVSYKKQQLLKLRQTLVRLRLLYGVHVAHRCSFLMLCFCVLFVFPLYSVSSVVSFSILSIHDCTFDLF